ncbi:MAG: sugar ABC transporter permease [Thermomicrobiales bacterium]
MRSIVLVPWAISGTVVGILWFWIYDGGYGTLNGVLCKLGLIDKYQAWLSSDGDRAMNLVVVAYVWNSAPMATLFFLAALQSVPGNLYSAAKMDGSSAWQRFRYITLPWLRPILVLVLLLSTINGIMAFDLIYFLTRGGPGISTTVFSWLGYNTIFSFFQFGQGTAILLILTFFCLVLALIYMMLLDRQPKEVRDRPAEATNRDLEEDLARRSNITMQIAALSRKGERKAFSGKKRTWLNSRSGRAWKNRLIYLPVAFIAIWSLAPVVWLLIMSLPFTDLLSKPPVSGPTSPSRTTRTSSRGNHPLTRPVCRWWRRGCRKRFANSTDRSGIGDDRLPRARLHGRVCVFPFRGERAFCACRCSA